MLDRQLIDHEFADIKDIIFLNVSSVVIPLKGFRMPSLGL